MPDFTPHAAERWAAAVVALTMSPHDVRSLAEWGRTVGCSRGALRAWCYAAHVGPRESLAFARLLRAVVVSRGGDWDPENLLDIVDPRTLKRLLELGGLGRCTVNGQSVEDYLARQQLVSNNIALQAVQARLRARVEQGTGAPSSAGPVQLPVADPRTPPDQERSDA